MLSTFAEIIIFCQKFYPQLGNLLFPSETPSDIPREFSTFGVIWPDKEVKNFLGRLSSYSEEIVIIVDQVDNMIESIGPSAVSEFLGNFVEVFKRTVSTSSNVEIFTPPFPVFAKLARVQAPIFQFDNEDLFELFQISLS